MLSVSASDWRWLLLHRYSRLRMPDCWVGTCLVTARDGKTCRVNIPLTKHTRLAGTGRVRLGATPTSAMRASQLQRVCIMPALMITSGLWVRFRWKGQL